MIRITDTPDPVDIPWLGRQLRATYWGGTFTDDQIAAALKNSLHFWAIDYEAEIAKPVGFARLLCDGALISTITDFFVIPAYQGQHIGDQLMQFILEHPMVKPTGIVLASKNASGFYAKWGFQRNHDPLMILPPQ